MAIAKSRAVTVGELENLVTDLRDLLANKDLDSLPEIKALRQRLDDGLQTVRDTAQSVRDSAVEAAQQAARQAREAAVVADQYAHDEPWRVAGGALFLGAALGFLLGRR